MSDKNKIIDDIINEKHKSNYDDKYVSKDFLFEDIMREYGKEKNKKSPISNEPAPISSASLQDNDTKIPVFADDILPILPVKNDQAVNIALFNTVSMNNITLPVKPENKDKSVETDNKRFFDTNTIEFLKEGALVPDTKKEEMSKTFLAGKSFLEEEDDEEEPAPIYKKDQEPEIEDFDGPQDIESIKKDLILQKRGLIFKSFFTAIVSVLLLYLNIAATINTYIPPVLHPNTNIFAFGFANSLLTFILIIVCFNTVLDGIGSFFKLRLSNDTLPAIAVVVSLIHSITISFTGTGAVGITTLYNGVAALSMFFVMMGKFFFVSNVSANFNIISSDKEKLACVKGDTGYSLKALYKDEGNVCVTKSVKIVTGFLDRSFSDDPSERASSRAGIISFLIIIASIVLSWIMRGPSFVLPSLAAVCAISASFMSELAFALPFYLISGKVRKSGGAIIGYDAANNFENTDVLILKDTDLFPAEKSSMFSMKITDRARIDEVILNAASLISSTNGPLSDAFIRILDKKENMLRPVEEFKYHEGRGLSGIICGKRFFAGNATFLNSCGIEMPSEDYEIKYGRGGKSVILFGGEGKILAVFVVGYAINDEFAKIIKRLDSSDFTLGVISSDNNITEELIENKYGLERTAVIIPPNNEAQIYGENMKPEEKYPAKIISNGGAAGICTALEACARIKSAVRACVWLRTAGAIAGGLIMLYLAIVSKVPIGAEKIALFQLLWMIPFLFTVGFKSR